MAIIRLTASIFFFLKNVHKFEWNQIRCFVVFLQSLMILFWFFFLVFTCSGSWDIYQLFANHSQSVIQADCKNSQWGHCNECSTVWIVFVFYLSFSLFIEHFVCFCRGFTRKPGGGVARILPCFYLAAESLVINIFFYILKCKQKSV